ncbi:hypothetical protein ACLD9W_06010 [Neisseria sp. WLZKY-1]|uniref:hypothetical protein n=1 Tax=Neisseria sp. WLZKY-1 TaxID=3390377 RepID=UPI003978181A
MAEQADKHGIPSAVVRLPGSRAIRSAFSRQEFCRRLMIPIPQQKRPSESPIRDFRRPFTVLPV